MDTGPENVHVAEEGNDEFNTADDSCLDLVPSLDMCFDTMEEAKTFYSDYGKRSGFGVRTRTSKKDKNNEVYYLRLVCSREGKYVSSIRPEVKTLPTQYNQCPAGITISRKDEKWFVRKVALQHSHDLCPQTSNLIRGNRKLKMHAKHTLEVNDIAGVRINKSYLTIVGEAGGYENMQFMERDVRNFIDQQRRSLCKESDGQALLRHFSKMRDLNNDFFYDIEMDECNRITSVFWADARSRAACQEFGDVVSFDTTYLTNKYDMSFAPFVGVNHHGQSILLGCGLLSFEDTSSFVWLFECWLRCMENNAPDSIVTDQCKAMANAIQEVFPKTKHKWCLWHIMKKIPEKFQGYKNYVGIKSDIKVFVYDYSSTVNFEIGWEKLLSKHGLENNEWLCNLYEDREKWVPCYLKNHFWAGMSTTQRSEGMNAFFDGFINSSTTLHEFVIQYDNALKFKAQKEIEVDFSSLNTTVACGSQSPIERQFQDEYTHAKFEEVQMEFRSRMNCFIKDTVMDGNYIKYTIKEECMSDGKCSTNITMLNLTLLHTIQVSRAYCLSLEASFVVIPYWFSVSKMYIKSPPNMFLDVGAKTSEGSTQLLEQLTVLYSRNPRCKDISRCVSDSMIYLRLHVNLNVLQLTWKKN
ncbi:protein FAR-RED IMPAIRED RESPONSE 1-like [Vigna radiata var. radiata]|uniref:Protein FAR-RED IMPAIRED RESPONSE 1-like n=1 Tax=Vigna radiata var. radiata TaxID=3916 RepID=A0A1S3TXY0_VIGRR|nr:protein FAR-RED IMPAIRED RESPONSE 1-like [Vigna radiata var. radiata]